MSARMDQMTRGRRGGGRRRWRAAVASATLLAVPLVGLPAVAYAAEPGYPVFTGIVAQGVRRFAPSSLIDMLIDMEGEPPRPTPASVASVAGAAPVQAAPILTSELSGSVLGSTTVVSLGLERLPVALPLSTMPLLSPQRWPDVLAGTPLAGLPLVGVTWSQVASLSPRPTGLAELTVGEVDWSGSLLRDLPLAAFTFGGTSVTDIDIPLQPGEPASDTTSAQRWCWLLNSAQAGSCPSPDFVTGKTLIDLGVQGAAIKDLPLKSIPLKSIDLAASPLKSIPLKSIVLQSVPLKSIPLKSIDLTASPLKSIPLKSIDPVGSALGSVPLKSIDWTASPLGSMPLTSIDLANSAIGSLPVWGFDWTSAPVRSIPVTSLDPVRFEVQSIGLNHIDWTAAPLRLAPVSNVDLTASPLGSLPLDLLRQGGARVTEMPLASIDFSVAPLASIPLGSIDLAAATLDTLPLSALDWTAAGLGSAALSAFSVAGTPLAGIPVTSLANPAGVAACAGPTAWTCASGATLGQLAAAGLLPGATLRDIGGAGFATQSVTLAGLLAARSATSTLAPTLGDLRLDRANAASNVRIADLVGAVAAPVTPVLSDLALGSASLTVTLGDLGLGQLADTPDTLAGLIRVMRPGSPAITLGDLRLDLVSGGRPVLTVEALVDGLTDPALTPTLGDLRLDLASGVETLLLEALLAHPFGGALDAFVLGDVGSYTTITGQQVTLGDLGSWALPGGFEITLGDLAPYLDGSVTLADVLLALVPATSFPFESYPYASIGLGDPWRGGFAPVDPTGMPSRGIWRQGAAVFPITFTVAGPTSSSQPVDLVVTLPPGVADAYQAAASGPHPLEYVNTFTTDHLGDGRLRVTLPNVAIPVGDTWTVSMMYPGASALGPVSFEVAVVDHATGAVTSSARFEETPAVDPVEPSTPQELLPYSLQAGVSREDFIPVLPYNPRGCSPALATCPKELVFTDDLVAGYLGSVGDVDWYRLPEVKAGTRIMADLTNLPLDADLVLYGPKGLDQAPTLFPATAGLPGSLVEDPGLGVGQAASALAINDLGSLKLDHGYIEPTTGEVVAPWTPLSISQHRGLENEGVGAIAPVDGDYIVQVSGYNTQTASTPYTLRVRALGTNEPQVCAPRTFPNPTPAPAGAGAVDPQANALFLTNPSRLAASFGADAAAEVASELSATVDWLTAHPDKGIVPAVVPVDGYPEVASAYAAWDADPCNVSAANGVTRAITKVLHDLTSAGSQLTYLTVVGGDDILPMGRVPDLTRVANEAEYAATFGSTGNPMSAAQAGGYTLTDDAYGDPNPVALGTGTALFVPRISVGRLVEAPGQIQAALAAYRASEGVLATGTALVSGYDFLADGATAVATRLGTGGRSVDSSLITAPGAPGWNSGDLLGKLFPTGAAAPLIASVNAHYDHQGLLSAAGDAAGGTDILGNDEVAARAGTHALAGRLLFTMGCHAGLSVPDSYVAGTDAAAEASDWAQTLAEANVAVYVANTGFGIGDSSSVAYSERLMGLYAKLLDGSMTVGQALTYAKQAYYGSLGAVGVYDTKILQQTAFYGLPFWQVDLVAPAPTRPSLPAPMGTDPVTGLAAMPLTLSPTLAQVTTPTGRFWTANGETPQVTHFQPVQPKTTVSVADSTLVARGVLITALSSHDVPGVMPVVDTPVVDSSTSAPPVRSDDAAWPPTIASLTTSQAAYGRAQDLVVMPGQFTGSTHDGTGIQRLFDTVGVTVLYGPEGSADSTPPTIDKAAATLTGSILDFAVSTSDLGTDAGSPAAPAKAVSVGYQDTDGSWHFVELTRASDTEWRGTSALTGPSPTVAYYFVQSVDAAGNVRLAGGKVAGYAAYADVTAPTITATISPAPNAAGWIQGTRATVTFTCTDTGSGIADEACPAPIDVTADGATVVTGTVRDRAGNPASTSTTVQFDGTAPLVTFTVTPTGWSTAASATVTFTCTDAGSGLAAPCPDPVVVTTEGTTTVERQVTDRAGNTTTETATVHLDRTAPTITATVTPAPTPSGWSAGTTATVSFRCADTGSGVAGSCPAPVTVAEGVSHVGARAYDKAGNVADSFLTVPLDGTAPTVTVVGTAPSLSCLTTDALSGVATSATGTLVAGTNSAGLATTTITCTGGTDQAGNVAPPLTRTAVNAMTFSGYDAPILGAPDINQAPRKRPLTLTFRLSQGSTPVATLAAITAVDVRPVSCSPWAATTGTWTPANSKVQVNDKSTGYRLMWKTPATAGCYELRLTLADNTSQVTRFTLV